jgi:hypothetical protein
MNIELLLCDGYSKGVDSDGNFMDGKSSGQILLDSLKDLTILFQYLDSTRTAMLRSACVTLFFNALVSRWASSG